QNSHDKHVYATDNTTVCQKCHPTANPTTLNRLATDNWARHLNDNVDVAQGNGASFAWAQGTHTCTNISCHGGAGTSAKWGDSLGCSACHLAAGPNGDVDDFGTGTAASMTGNGITARIDNAEWLYSGHGKQSGTYDCSVNVAAAFAGTNPCLYCHDDTVGHNNTGNIFRLANNNYYGNGWNDVCLICHRKTGGAAGYNYPGGPGLKVSLSLVDTAHYGAKHGAATDNGGRFCYDCHDPHGDRISTGGNIFMIGKRVTMAHDNVTGIATGGNDNSHRPAPTFTSNASGTNYADNVTRLGICQVCHTTGMVNHWTNSTPWSDGHNASTRCTQCHSHDGNFKGSGSCIGCHGTPMGSAPVRRQVTGAAGDFMEATHHVTNYIDNTADNAVQNIDCSKCHWEGYLTGDTILAGRTPAKQGDTNPAFHWADDSNNATAKFVQLRVWSSTTAPIAYNNNATTGSAIEWRNDAVWNSAANAINLNHHCLGCHSSSIGAATPFSDGRSPRVRSWDGLDIGTKYLQTGATKLNKYTPQKFVNNTVPSITKSYSAHYDTRNNQRGVATAGAWADDQSPLPTTDTATGTVACFDCHNSHGSPLVGTAALPLTSFADNASLAVGLDNAYVGGLFKKTTAGESGYSTTYNPAANATDNYGIGAELCFDCHVGSDAAVPKNYTYWNHAAGAPVAGYYDPITWRTGFTAGTQGLWNRSLTWQGSFAFKDNTIRSSHFLPSTTNSTGTAITRQTTASNKLNGRCTACHDPHGVTTNTSHIANQNYGVPLLKGSWLSSPYLEDRPGDLNVSWNNYTSRNTTVWRGYNSWTATITVNATNGYMKWGPRHSSKYEWNRPAILGGGYGTGPGAAGSNDNTGGYGHDGFFIDENTFGLTFGGNANYNMFNANSNSTALNWRNVWGSSTANTAANNTSVPATISETNATFAGLCEHCHAASALKATNSKLAGSGVIASAHLTVRNYGPMTHDIVLANFFNNTTNNGQHSQQAYEARFHDAGGDEQWRDAWPAGNGDSATGAPVSWGLGFGAGANTNQRTGGYVQNNYHNFPCSKCHTPHTSRLPRLLKTNCLDVNIGGNTQTLNQRHSKNANANIYRMRTSSGTNSNNGFSGARPVRCHNNGFYITGTGATDTRWNTVTPW
ncbi:MAG: hypothetical protein PHP88_02350, partial [bacterium]|nr:hypothetical protein [bacterium]